jgi:DNA-binding NtrC family response regulator
MAPQDSEEATQLVRPRALLVDDELSHLEAMQALVEHQGFATRTATSLETARKALDEEHFDVLITDLQLPDGMSLELLPLWSSARTWTSCWSRATRASRPPCARCAAARADYLTKPIDVRRLEKVLAHVQRAVRLRGQVVRCADELRDLGRFGRMIGASTSMQAIYDQVLKVARTDATVLVTGETGTGKELVAETLHERPRARTGPFVPLNCGAISPNLIESELFGHEKGSFTGAPSAGGLLRARRRRHALPRRDHRDAVELQVKLLRALESSTVQRVGGNDRSRSTCAWSRRPTAIRTASVADGTLREDLLYRLLVFPIHLPPLRSRADDLDLLAEHFLAQLNRPRGHAQGAHARGARAAAPPLVAGQRARAQERDRARVHHGRDRCRRRVHLAGGRRHVQRIRRREPGHPRRDVETTRSSASSRSPRSITTARRSAPPRCSGSA